VVPRIRTHVFTQSPDDNRKWTVSRIRPVPKKCGERSNCAKPRRLILRKIRRKLFSNEKERLQQRRLALQKKEYDGLVIVNNNRIDEVVEQSDNVDVIEKEMKRKQAAYKDAIERLKSLVREKQDNNGKEQSGKIVSVTYTTSTD